jgi:hypothetical protein
MYFIFDYNKKMTFPYTLKSKEMITSLLNEVDQNMFTSFEYKNTTSFLKKFYKVFNEANSYVSKIDILKHKSFEKSNFETFEKPDDFEYILTEIKKNIENNITSQIKFSFKNFFSRNINILLAFTNSNKLSSYELIETIKKMLIWIYIISKYTVKCPNNNNLLNIFIFQTDLEKNLPDSGKDIERINVNTGFTTSCNTNSEIVIFRKEEWFKVFLHETFHNFGLDFSYSGGSFTEKIIKCIFNVNVKIKLYEAYCEFWARVFNCLILSISTTTNETDYIKTSTYLIHIERLFSYLQTVKLLNHMSLDYKDIVTLFGKKHTNFKQKTSLLSYYIICCIMFDNFEKFLLWSSQNNTNDLLNIQFLKPKKHQLNFCLFINQHHDSNLLLSNLNFFKNILKKKHLKDTALMKTFRKSIIETK